MTPPPRAGWNRLDLAGAALILVIGVITITLYGEALVTVTWQRLVAYRLHGAAMTDPVCFSAFCDYPDFWGAGILARGHMLAVLYQPDAFLAWRRALFQHDIPPLNWMYPPPALLPAALVSLAPLGAGYFYWAGGLALLAVVLLRRAGVGWAPIAVSLLGPAAMWNLLLGQVGILCGGLFIAGLLNMRTRPKTAGVLLACLSIKPQFCALAPFVLLASRNRRAILAAAAAALLILAATIFCFGAESWLLFVGAGLKSSAFLLRFPYMDAQIHAISVFWALRSCHAPIAAAYAGQAAAAAAAIFVSWRAWRMTEADPAARIALTACLLPLAAPYGYTDDLFGFTVAFTMLARRDAMGLNLAITLLWLSPAILPLVYLRWHIVAAPLVFGSGAILAWRLMTAPQAARPA